MDPQDDVDGLAVAAFGRWALQTADAHWAAESIPHEPTRAFLTATGLPVEAVSLFALDDAFETVPRTLEDLPAGLTAPVDPQIRAEYGGLIVLGGIGDDEAFLDPRDGRVLSFVNWTSPPHLLNSGVAEFVYFLAYVETHRRQDGVLLDDLPTDEGYAAAGRIVEHLTEVDRAAMVDPQVSDDGTTWFNWVSDGFAIGLFQDWAWDGAIGHFLRHGIDPTGREPRRPLPWHMTAWPSAGSDR